MKKFLCLLLAILFLPVSSMAENVLDTVMQKFGYGWEYGQYYLATSPYKLIIPDDMWPIEPPGNMVFAAQTKSYEKTGGKIIEGLYGRGATAQQIAQMQADSLISSTQQSGQSTVFVGQENYDLWQEELMLQNVATYIETIEIPYGEQTIYAMLMLENYNRYDAINTTAVYAFDFNEGQNVYMVSYILIESVDPTLPADTYCSKVDGIRQQLIDFVGTVLVEK